MRILQRFYGSGNFKLIKAGLFLAAIVLVLMSSFNVLHFDKIKLQFVERNPIDQRKITLDSAEKTTEETKELRGDEDELDYDTNYMPYLFKKYHRPRFVFGPGRQRPVRVAIGIPHVKRPTGSSYLNKTLDSLIKRIFPDDEDQIAIVIFIAEKDDQAYVRSQTKYLYNRYKREFDSGMLQVIGPPENFYPNFQQLIPNLGDAKNRVWWRSKEVLDAALLMLYCDKLADYYLMLEDDVIASIGYMRKIFEYLDDYSQDDFLMIAAADYGSIAKIFKKKDIPLWVSSLLSFYNQEPVDWLLVDTARLLACPGLTPDMCEATVSRRIQIMPTSLFLHVGYDSSLSGKTHTRERVKERAFGKVGSTNKHRNPPAQVKVTRSLELTTEDVILWYNDSGGLTHEFCLDKSSENDMIEFRFQSVHAVVQILLKTSIFGEEDDSRICEGCASLGIAEKFLAKTKYSKYSECAVSDCAGNLECRFLEPKSVEGFRLTTRKSFEKKTCFSVVYVKVDGSSS